MALSNILREFLVRIRYDTDDASRKSFTESVKETTKLVFELGAAIEATAAAVVAGIAKMSSGMERFYFISQRTGSSVGNIKALAAAAEQMGIGAEAAYSALENIAGFLRSSPLAGGLLKRLGIDPGQDPEKIFEQLGKAFANMPVWMAKSYASVLGIDENTMLAMRRGMGQYLQDYQQILKRVGVDEDKAAAGAHAFMVQLRQSLNLMKVFSDYVLQLVGERASNDIKRFTDTVEKNFQKIADITAWIITWFLRAADVVTRLAVRGVEMLSGLYDKFMELPKVIRLVMEAIAGLVIAFSAFDWPVLAIGALAAAILLLYDDYKTWKEGGKHLIDWDRWVKDFDEAKDYLLSWWHWIVDLFKNNTWHLRTAAEFLYILPALIINNWKPITAFFRTLWTDVVNVFDWALAKIQPLLDVLKSGVTWIGNSWLGRRIAALSGAVSNAAGNVDSWVQGQVEGAAGTVLNAIGSGSGGATSGVDTGGGGGSRHNPGNLRIPGSTTGFQSFPDDATGLAAMRDQLRRYAGRGLNTIRKILNTYAPPSENNTAGYGQNVASWTGFGVDAPLDLNNASTMAKMLVAMTRQEGHPMSMALANQVAGGGNGVQVQQNNNYHINEAHDARATGAAVQVAQDTSNQRLVRNLRPLTQ